MPAFSGRGGPSLEGHPLDQLLVSARVSAPRCRRPLFQCARSRLCLFRLPQTSCHRRVPCRLPCQSIRRCRQWAILGAFNRAFKPYLPSPGHVWNGMYGHFQGPPSYDGSAPFFCHGPSFAACFGGIRPAALTLVCRRVFRCSPRLPGRPLLAALLRVFLHLGALFNVIGVLFKLTFYCYQAQPSLTGASAFGDATPSLLACP